MVYPHHPPHHASSVQPSDCLIPAPPPPTKKTSTQCTPAGTVRVVEEAKVTTFGLAQDTAQSAQLTLSAGLSATQVFHDFTNHSLQVYVQELHREQDSINTLIYSPPSISLVWGQSVALAGIGHVQ